MELTADIVKKDLQGLVENKKKEIEKSMPEPEKKALEETRKKEQEAKLAEEAKKAKDAAILAKKDEELSDVEKPIKAKLLEEKRKEEESKLSADEKIKRAKEESQKRIDEIKNEMKQSEDKHSKKYEELEKSLAILRQENESLNKKLSKPAEDDPAVTLKVKEAERLSKYLEEDKSKPREQRREMSKDELNDWLLEDLDSATDWKIERNMRRSNERSRDVQTFRKELATKDFSEKQSESNAKVIIRHPDLDTSKREAELKAQNKPDEEIHETLCQENEKYRLCAEIVKSNPEKYLTTPNGPELVMQEMEKRLEIKPVESDKRIEELTKKNEELEARLASLENSDTGINSTTVRRQASSEKLTEQEEDFVQTLKELKTPQANIDSALKKFRERKKNAG